MFSSTAKKARKNRWEKPPEFSTSVQTNKNRVSEGQSNPTGTCQFYSSQIPHFVWDTVFAPAAIICHLSKPSVLFLLKSLRGESSGGERPRLSSAVLTPRTASLDVTLTQSVKPAHFHLCLVTALVRASLLISAP